MLFDPCALTRFIITALESGDWARTDPLFSLLSTQAIYQTAQMETFALAQLATIEYKNCVHFRQ